jgi:5'-nucleotidase
VAAAREAAILHCRAIALSQYISPNGRLDWEVTGSHAERVIAMLLTKELPAGHYFNVNLPHPLGADDRLRHRFCRLDRNPHGYTFRREGEDYHYLGVIHERPREPDRDVDVCFGGRVAITRLRI